MIRNMIKALSGDMCFKEIAVNGSNITLLHYPMLCYISDELRSLKLHPIAVEITKCQSKKLVILLTSYSGILLFILRQ